MPAWRRICCPVDFSAASRRAVQYAAELARTSRAHLTILHVMPRSLALQPHLFAPPVAARVSSHLQEDLASWTREAETVALGRVESTVLSGSPVEQIVAFTQECGFDLVVIGARRRFLSSLWDTRAVEILRRVTCSVLVIPPDPAAALPFRA